MKYLRKITLLILWIGVFVSAVAADGRPRDVVVRVFKIPAVQQVEMIWPDGNGVNTEGNFSGEVTANFPDGVVFLETDLAVNASKEAVSRVVQDKVVFGRGAFIPTAVRIEEVEALGLRLAGSSPSAQSKHEEKTGEGRSNDYEIRAEWPAGGGDSAFVRIKMKAGWSAGGGTIGVGFSSDVFRQTVEVPEAKLRLIGFRSIDKKTILWLGVCAVPAAAPGAPAGADGLRTN